MFYKIVEHCQEVPLCERCFASFKEGRTRCVGKSCAILQESDTSLTIIESFAAWMQCVDAPIDR